MKIFSLIAAVFFFTINLNEVWAQNFSSGNKHVSAEIVFDVENLQVVDRADGKIARIGIRFIIEDGWHIYWKNPGESGKSTIINWDLPEDWKISELYWPIPERYIERGGIRTYSYSKETLIFGDLLNPPLVPDSDKEIEFKAKVSFLVCSDRCIPGNIELSKKILLSLSAQESPSKDYKSFKTFEKLVPKNITFNALEKEYKIKTFFNRKQEEVSELIFTLPPSYINANFFDTSADHLVKSSKIARTPQETSLKFDLEETSSSLKEISGVLTLKNNTGELTIFEFSNVNVNEFKPFETTSNKAGVNFSENFFLTHNEDLLHESKIKNTELNNAASDIKADNHELIFILFSAFLGGIILNFMPCVLPILSIKLFGLIKCKERLAKQNLTDALLFSFGIILSFLALALAVVILKFSGQKVGWGFQFQNLWFVVAMISFLLILALGFFDIINFSIPGISKLDKLDNRLGSSHALKSIFDGFLITILSTPCTAPFLGTALAFAFTQSSKMLFLIFTLIALGLSFPYLIVSTNPKLLKFFPKPGEWMNHLKQFMGFGLLATIIWLLQVVSKIRPDGIIQEVHIKLAIFGITLLLFFWIIKIRSKTAKFELFSYVLFGLLLIVTLSSITNIYITKTSIDKDQKNSWIDFKSVILDRIDKPVFIDFTAAWCITCKYNENFILSNDEIVKTFKALNYTLVKADWTSADEQVSAALERFNGNGVPHYVILRADGKIKILPTILTVDLLKGEL